MELSNYSIATSSQAPKSERRTPMHRFSVVRDIWLLKEVLAVNPFAEPKGWATVSENLSELIPGLTERCCRERTTRLVKKFQDDTIKLLRKSGTEEQYDEREQLIQEIISIKDDAQRMAGNRQGSQKIKLEIDTSVDNEIQQAALSGIPGNDSESSSDNSLDGNVFWKRAYKLVNAVSYLKEQHEEEKPMKEAKFKMDLDILEIKRRRLALEERQQEIDHDQQLKKLALEEKKLELEKERQQMEKERQQHEREERREDRKMMMALLEVALKK